MLLHALPGVLRLDSSQELIPVFDECETSTQIPDSIYQKAAIAGVLMPTAAGAQIPQEWQGRFPIIGGIAAHEWDGFHDFILHDELGRVGGIGFENGLLGGTTLCLPVIQQHGSQAVKEAVVPPVLFGQARISLAITEPTAGSDVQGLQTSIQLSKKEGFVVVDGTKKWITGGMYAKFFLTLAREQSGGFTLIVVPRSNGVSTRHMTMSGSGAAGTAFVEFDQVEVSIQMIVGQRGNGLKYTMSNFNHERLFIGIQALRCARICLEDSIGYALKRETFGKKLIDHPVIRFKVAHMARKVESLHSWLESLIYQSDALSKQDRDLIMSGPTATFKAHAGLVLENVVREAVQIVGGIGLTRGGRGERIERIWRDVKAITVPGGSEEILLDLGTRRARKVYESQSKIKASL